MALPIIYIASSFLIFFNVEPLKIIGILLSICYLPGLSLLVVGREDKLLFEDLILAIPFSFGLSSLAIIALLFVGIPVASIPIVIHVAIGIVIIVYFVFDRKRLMSLKFYLSRQELVFFMFALLITLLFSIPFILGGPDKGPIANHAFHHSSLVSQILNGIFPPENPGLGGTRIGYYWGFHALVAAITSQTDYHQLQIIFSFNIIAFILIFCVAYSFAKCLDLSEGYRYILPLAVIGLMRADAGIFIIWKLFSSDSHQFMNLISQNNLLPMDILESWLAGLPWYDTRLFFINKFYNISAMLPAIGLCLSYFLLVLITIKNEFTGRRMYFWGIGIIIMACVLIYPPLAIVPLSHAPIWSGYIFLSEKKDLGSRFRKAFKIILPYVMALLVVSTYVIYIMSSRRISSGGQGGVFALDFYDQSVKNLIAFLIPLPLIVFGVWTVMKQLKLSHESIFLIIGSVTVLGLSAFTRWPFDNSYKFNYILAFFFSILTVFAFFQIMNSLSGDWFRRFLMIGMVTFLLITPIVVEASYIISCLSMDQYFQFSDGHIIYAQDKRKNDAYAWIRDNTPFDSLIMMSYFETPVPYSGLNPNYEVAAISERNLYVIKDTDYTVSNPEYSKRVLYREKLFADPDNRGVIEFFKSLNSPVYLLIEKDLPDRFLVEDRFKDFPVNPGAPFKLVFNNGKQRIYLIQY
jgi:hypothetical protein